MTFDGAREAPLGQMFQPGDVIVMEGPVKNLFDVSITKNYPDSTVTYDVQKRIEGTSIDLANGSTRTFYVLPTPDELNEAFPDLEMTQDMKESFLGWELTRIQIQKSGYVFYTFHMRHDKKYKISYVNVTNQNSGAALAEGSPEYYYFEKGVILKDAIPPEGKEFEGWYEAEDENFEKRLYCIPPSYEGKKGWSIMPHFVTSGQAQDAALVYMLDGGQNSELNPSIYTYGKGVASLMAPNKPGYTFEGWYETEDFDGEPVTSIAGSQRGTVVLYAKFTAQTYQITADLNGSQIDSEMPTEYCTDTPFVIFPECKKIGYTFEGWRCQETNELLWGLAGGDFGNLTLTAEFSGNGIQDGDVVIDETNFPDETLLDELRKYDADGDHVLSVEERKQVKKLSFFLCSSFDTTGLSYFTELSELVLYDVGLKSINLRPFKKLQVLKILANNLQELDLSQNTELTELYVASNELTTLDLTNQTKLQTINCGENYLVTLSLGENTQLEKLICNKNYLYTLDLSSLAKLTYLDCSENQLMTLDLSHNVNLEELYAQKNQLEQLDTSHNEKMELINCYNNRLTSLDLRGNATLTSLTCSENELTSLLLNPNVEYIYGAQNELESLDLSGCNKLERIEMSCNHLTSLSMNDCTSMIREDYFVYDKYLQTHVVHLADDTPYAFENFPEGFSAENVSKVYYATKTEYGLMPASGLKSASDVVSEIATASADKLAYQNYADKILKDTEKDMPCFVYTYQAEDTGFFTLDVFNLVCPLTHVPGREPTCQSNGWKDYYRAECGKLFEDAQGTKEITDFDAWMDGAGKLDKVEHVYEDTYSADTTGHWYACKWCLDKKDFQPHRSNGADPAEADEICLDCQFVIHPVYTHVHACEDTLQKDATCTSDGYNLHFRCSCKHYFEDSECTKEILDINAWKMNEGKLSATGHQGGEATCQVRAICDICQAPYGVLAEHRESDVYQTNAYEHWKECTVCHARLEVEKHFSQTKPLCDKQYVCDICDKPYGERVSHVENTDFDMDETTHWHHCVNCQKKITVGKHEIVEVAEQPASCTKPGLTAGRICSVCGFEVIQQQVIPALGHTWDAGVVTKVATKNTEGEKKYTCQLCGEVRLEKISRIPRKVGDVFIDSVTQAKYKILSIQAEAQTGTVSYLFSTNKKKTSVKIPDKVKIDDVTYKVTEVAGKAFQNNKKLTKIMIGKNVTTIGDKAFYKCSALTKITIPAKVSRIGKYAFYGCSKLKNIVFKTTKLTSRKVHKKAFGKNAKKVTVTLPKLKGKRKAAYQKMLKSKGLKKAKFK